MKQLASEYCAARREDKTILLKKGFVVEADKICAEAECAVVGASVKYKYLPGQCGLNGTVCLPLPRGSQLIYSNACGKKTGYPPTDELGQHDPCQASTGYQTKVGQCFTPLEGHVSDRSEVVKVNSALAQDLATLVARRVRASYRCIPIGSRYNSAPDRDCCVRAGGTFVAAEQVEVTDDEFLKTANDRQLELVGLEAVESGIDHCVPTMRREPEQSPPPGPPAAKTGGGSH